ncbi:MAG: response regulator [Bacteroidales bacterium]|jgi:DNA-binding NtrC family response regulator|nr:response regulator [Bacteroidales bacterium]
MHQAKNILVVDDDLAIREVLLNALSKRGYNVVVAEDGAIAIKELSLHPFDLVITDIIMPERDGVELLFTIRRHYPHIKTIAMSAGGRILAEDLLQMARNIGAFAIMHKPFSIQDLYETIARVLDKEIPAEDDFLL